MKKSFQSFSLSILLLCLLFLTSCKQEQINNEEFDFENYKKEIQQNQDYIDYINTGSLLFQQLADKQIAIFDIHNELSSKGDHVNYCNVDMALIKRYRGAQKLVDGFCNLKTAKIKLLTNQDLQLELTEEQNKELYNFNYTTPSLDNQATLRVQDCLAGFQNVIAFYDQICDGALDPQNCTDNGINYAIMSYDLCCSQGGTGCPPGQIINTGSN
ncbi:MAG: hypothetical protein AB8F94_25310 [Saprospiraceae bacterium]